MGIYPQDTGALVNHSLYFTMNSGKAADLGLSTATTEAHIIFRDLQDGLDSCAECGT